MTQKTSFKSRMKQAFSFFRSDLRACTPLLVVFGLISAVTVVICYTICVVLGDDMTFTGALLSLNFLGVTNSGTGIIEIFQYSSANLIYLISIIFTIIYTVRIYSYLHNKRKADLYGSLPIGRSTLFVTKTASAYLMSIIPTLFFLGVISIITVCTGNSVISELSSMFLKICLGTLASISFFGLIAICCGTMLNSVLMFIAVCVAYPLSAIFIKGIVVGCFDGFYVGNKDLATLYNAAFAFLYPSLRESFGIPILEAMACGTPVVTGNVSAMPEVAGKGAILVNPQEPQKIADALLRLENDATLYQQQVNYSLERVKLFSWRHTAQEYVNIYQSIHD